jgi:hypothetical protein
MTETLIVGATMAVSLGSALLMQKALLGAMLYAIDPKRQAGHRRQSN